MFPSVTFARNHRSSSAGIRGHLQPETPVTFAGIRNVIGYDLAAFFKQNSEQLHAEIDAVLKALLAPEGK